MKKLLSASVVVLSVISYAQQIDFEEYELPNGMHVILHQDNSVPVVTTSVMYNVGSKNENPNQTGFAHFFEHLLFEGTKNIQRGEWDVMVADNGGSSNANTSSDRTYYHLTFPSSAEQLSIWMESERLRHPIINQVGVDTQRSVIKEEKKVTMDNQPYGNMMPAVQKYLFNKHPYHWHVMGSMDHLDTATLENFKDFYKKFYVPNNATLVVAGNIKPEQTKKWIAEYFGTIPRGKDVQQPNVQEDPIVKSQTFEYKDPNIQAPAYIYNYRVPSKKDREGYVLDVISEYLSGGNASVLKKNLVYSGKAVEASTMGFGFMDHDTFSFFVIPMEGVSQKELEKDFDNEIKKLQTNLISERDLQKLQNQFESDFISNNSSMEGIASSLATYHRMYGNTNLINTELDIYKSITREEIREAAKKYLNPNQRIIINYLPQ